MQGTQEKQVWSWVGKISWSRNPSSIQCAVINPILLTPLLFPFGNCVCFLCLWVWFCFINKFICTIFLYWCKGLTHWKRPWCWERLKTGGEGNNRGWDGWMASLTRWTWVWARSGGWWSTGKPGVLQSMGSQRVGHDWVTELYYFLDPTYKWDHIIFVFLWLTYFT